MAADNTVIMAVLFLIIGAKLLGDGISGLEPEQSDHAAETPHREQRDEHDAAGQRARMRTARRGRGRR